MCWSSPASRCGPRWMSSAQSAPCFTCGPAPATRTSSRLCDVDPQGRSWNITDGILRLSSGALAEQAVTVLMSSTAHQLAAGHRLRLQVSGGAHPRFARNTGTGEPLVTATRLVPTDIEVYHDQARPSALLLPTAVTTANR